MICQLGLLSRHLPRGAEGKHGKIHSGYWLFEYCNSPLQAIKLCFSYLCPECCQCHCMSRRNADFLCDTNLVFCETVE